MTILELQNENSGETVTNIISALSADNTLTESDRATFNRLNADGYGKIIDDSLSCMYGLNELRPTVLQTYLTRPFWEINISAYLRRRVEYFKKCFMYIDAEYNPVENYLGSEEETVTEERDERYTSTSNSYGADITRQNIAQKQNTNAYGAATDETTPADYTETTTAAERDTTTQTAPFESDTFHNENKVIEKMKAGESDVKSVEYESVEQTVRGAHTDTFTEGAHNDTITRDAKTDTQIENSRPYTDVITREFMRHGNIGVLSAGELMEKDAAFWASFGWLYDTTHDISNLISKAVWAL